MEQSLLYSPGTVAVSIVVGTIFVILPTKESKKQIEKAPIVIKMGAIFTLPR